MSMVRVILLDFAVMRQPRIYKPPCALNKAVIFHLYCIFSVIELESKNKPLCEILTIRNLLNILPHDKKPIVFMRTFTGQIQLMKFRLPLGTNERSFKGIYTPVEDKGCPLVFPPQRKAQKTDQNFRVWSVFIIKI